MILIALVAAFVINFAAWPISARLGHQVGITLSFYQYLNIFLGCFLPLLVLNATLGVAQSKNQFTAILGYSMDPRIGFLTVLGVGLLGNRSHPIAYLACASIVMFLLVAAGVSKYGKELGNSGDNSNNQDPELNKKLLSSILHAGLWGVASVIIGYSTSIAFTIADHNNAGYVLTILGGCFLLLSLLSALFLPLMRIVTVAIKAENYRLVERIYYIMFCIVGLLGFAMYVIVYYKGEELIRLWLGVKQVTSFNTSIMISGSLYAITRSIGIPISILIIANNGQRNYLLGPIIECIGAVSTTLIAINGLGVKWIFIVLITSSVLSIFATLSLALFRPNSIGLRNQKKIVISILCNCILLFILFLISKY